MKRPECIQEAELNWLTHMKTNDVFANDVFARVRRFRRSGTNAELLLIADWVLMPWSRNNTVTGYHPPISACSNKVRKPHLDALAGFANSPPEDMHPKQAFLVVVWPTVFRAAEMEQNKVSAVISAIFFHNPYHPFLISGSLPLP